MQSAIQSMLIWLVGFFVASTLWMVVGLTVIHLVRKRLAKRRAAQQTTPPAVPDCSVESSPEPRAIDSAAMEPAQR